MTVDAEHPRLRELHTELALADVVTFTAESHVQALCGQWLPAEDLSITYGLPGTLCLSCLAGVLVPTADPDPRGGSPGIPVRALRSSGSGRV